MKKLFTTAMLALVGAGVYAQAIPQTTQGTKVVSGSVRLMYEGSKDASNSFGGRNSNRQISLNPSVGYLIRDGLEMGMGIGLYRYTSTSKWDDGKSYTRYNDVSLQPYVRKYVALTEQLQLHGTAYAAVGLGNQTAKSNEDESAKVMRTSSNFGLGLYPGLTYFATPKLGFTATFGALSFTRNKHKPKEAVYETESTSHSFTADLSPSSISIGMGYFIAR